MMRITSSPPCSRYVCATSRTTIPAARPRVCQRSSPFSTRSMMLMACGSSKTRDAVSKLILCLARLRRFLFSSQMKRLSAVPQLYVQISEYVGESQEARAGAPHEKQILRYAQDDNVRAKVFTTDPPGSTIPQARLAVDLGGPVLRRG